MLCVTPLKEEGLTKYRWGEIFANHIANQGLVLECIRNPQHSRMIDWTRVSLPGLPAYWSSSQPPRPSHTLRKCFRVHKMTFHVHERHGNSNLKKTLS